MTANLYAWEQCLGLDPARADFESVVDRLCDPAAMAPPSDLMRGFVVALLERFPENDGRRVWADYPLIENVNGSFMNVAILWSAISEVGPFFLTTACARGLNVFDPQSGRLYCASH